MRKLQWRYMNVNKWKSKCIAFLMIFMMLSGCGADLKNQQQESAGEILTEGNQDTASVSIAEAEEYAGEPYVVIDENVPDFTDSELKTESFETYSELDSLGRCGAAYANIGKDLMPTEKRDSIGQVKPSGWHTVKYDWIDGKYLYNRCHLIGYQLTAENANEKNLITGTRYLNVEGMLPFENMVADYIKETGNHVLYRVTPIYDDDNLVASGVQMEAESVEDDGEGILFNVYCYNIQPGVVIDYALGDSRKTTDEVKESDNKFEYILNINTKKFHLPRCSGIKEIKEDNKCEYEGERDELILQGYQPCKRCNP